MKFSFAALLAVVPAALAGAPGKLSYDPVYGNAGQSTLTLACSDGDNGLYTKGYQTLGSIPNFPMVAAVPDVQGWNSPSCGACYKLYYKGTGKSVYVTAVDVGRGAFVGSQQVLDTLTNGRAVEVGTADISWVKAESVLCGM